MPLSQIDQQALDRWERRYQDPDWDPCHTVNWDPCAYVPRRCPACGSIDTEGGRCRWCQWENDND